MFRTEKEMNKLIKPISNILQFYSCPESCKALCCSECDINFGKKDYKAIIKEYPDKKTFIKHELIDNTLHSYNFTEKPCPMLKDNLCSIQDTKPFICKIYPFDFKSDDSDLLSIDPCQMGKLIIMDYLILTSTAVTNDNTMSTEEQEKFILILMKKVINVFRKTKKPTMNEIVPTAFIPIENLEAFYLFLNDVPKEMLIEKRNIIQQLVDDPTFQVD